MWPQLGKIRLRYVALLIFRALTARTASLIILSKVKWTYCVRMSGLLLSLSTLSSSFSLVYTLLVSLIRPDPILNTSLFQLLGYPGTLDCAKGHIQHHRLRALYYCPAT